MSNASMQKTVGHHRISCGMCNLNGIAAVLRSGLKLVLKRCGDVFGPRKDFRGHVAAPEAVDLGVRHEISLQTAAGPSCHHHTEPRIGELHALHSTSPTEKTECGHVRSC